MTKKELKAALDIALNENESLLDVDATVLHGLYLPDFKAPVVTTTRVVARMIRELAVRFDGTADAEALAEFGTVGRHRVLVVG